VLRACYEALRPGGRIAGYSIHAPPGLTEAQANRASEFGPSEVHAVSRHGDLFREAGFRVTVDEDVTEDFQATCEAIIQARHDLEDELRGLEGDVVFEEELNKKALTLQGISEGLLRRSLLVASRS
jgi:hypothetical protein